MCRNKVMLPLAQNESEVSVICSKRGWTGEKAEGEMFLLKGCCRAGLRAGCEGSTHAGCERSSAPCSSFQLPAQWLARWSIVKHGCGEVSFDEYSGIHPAPKVMNGRGNLALLPLPCKFSGGFVRKNQAL